MSFIHLSIFHEYTFTTSYIHTSTYSLHPYLWFIKFEVFHILWEKEEVIVLPIDMEVNIIVVKISFFYPYLQD